MTLDNITENQNLLFKVVVARVDYDFGHSAHCLPGSAYADGGFAELAVQLSKSGSTKPISPTIIVTLY